MTDAAAPQVGRLARRRVALFAMGLFVLLGFYLAFFADLYRRPETTESLVVEAADGRPTFDVYVEATNVDPVRQALDARLEFSTGRGEGKPLYPGTPRRAVTVRQSDRAYVVETRLPAGRAAAPATAQFGLDGSISSYPFDVYRGATTISAFEGEPPDATQFAVRLTLWERLAGWDVRVVARPAAPGETGLALAIEAKRPLAHVVFAVMIYGVMTVIALCGVAIGLLAFCGARKIEAAFSGALAAMLFAAPMLRNVMPGAPPLGVAADAYVFLWVQVALMLGLFLFVAAWARRGAPP